jgi:hypothetical protein
VLWAIISFQVLGWFSGIEHTLDGIDLMPGKAQFSLWALLKGIVVIAGFLIVTSLIARTIERRVMKLEGLAISTRIGISKFSTFALVALGILLGINASGVDLTALTVLTGAIGIGLGFGLQTIASNFVSGFVLLMDKSIKPGDVISFTGTTGNQQREFRLGAGAARPVHRDPRPRRRGDAGAEPALHQQPGGELELLRPARAHPPAGDDQLPGRSRTRAAGARRRGRQPPTHPQGPGSGLAAHELRELWYARRSALLDPRSHERRQQCPLRRENREIWRLFKKTRHHDPRAAT